MFYVAMTRAKERLTLTNARQRMLFGRTSTNLPSRFLEEVPAANSVWTGRQEPRLSTDAFGDHDFGSSLREERGHIREVPVRRHPQRPAPDRGFSAQTAAAGLPELRQGDMVRHKSFGEGMVLSVRKMGNDALVEVAFDQVGTKKLMLRAAAPHMEKM